MRALTLQPLPLPLPFPNFGRHYQLLAETIETHQSLFCVQTELDFLEQPITLERSFFGFVRLMYLDPYEEFQALYLRRGWNNLLSERPMKTEVNDQYGSLVYLSQILDLPEPHLGDAFDRLKELSQTYPFPDINSSTFLRGGAEEFLEALVSTVPERDSYNDSVLMPDNQLQDGNHGQNIYNDPYALVTFDASRDSDQHASTALSRYPNQPISQSRTSQNPTYSINSQCAPLAMIPMTRSRRRDQQVLAQSGFGVPPHPAPMAFATTHRRYNVDTFNGAPHPQHIQFGTVHRRPRNRQPLTMNTFTSEGTDQPMPGVLISDNQVLALAQPNEGLEQQIREVTGDASVGSFLDPVVDDDQSMIVIRMERDGQSARVIADSHNYARQGQRVNSLQQELGGIMDSDECTICKGSWTWVKGNNNGQPKTNPGEWRLVRLPCKHTYHEECLARWFLISPTPSHIYAIC